MRERVVAVGRNLLWSLATEKKKELVLQRCSISSLSASWNRESGHKIKRWVPWSMGALCAGVGAYVWGSAGKSECAIPFGNENAAASIVKVDECDTFDHVILGGGTAGCVIAYLLGKWVDEQNVPAKVLLVDGGPGFEKANPHLSAWYDMWGEFGKAHESVYEGDGTNKTSVYPITPSDHRGLGGCGAHDTRIYYLPSRKEQQEYADAFGWSLSEMKEYMQAAMNLEPAIKACPRGEEYFDLVIKELSERAGLKRLPDDRFHGNVVADSVAYFDVGGYALSDTRGIRWTPAMLINSPEDSTRPRSLRVLTGAEIDAISFREGDPTAVEGVTAKIDGKTQRICLADQGSVTLCAGSIGNAAILQRSGVGDAHVLKQVGIEPVIEHPEVGHGVDHEEIAVQYAPPPTWPGGTMPAGGVMGWALGIFKSLPELDQIMQAHFSIAGPPYDDEVTVVGTPNNTKPDQHKGYRVQIQSPSPDEAAILKYEYSPHEREVFLKGLKEMVGMFEKLRAAGLVGARVAPPVGTDLEDDDAVWAWIHDNKHTAYHWLGTCKAGLPGKVTPGTVVDHTFRLRMGTDSEQAVDNLFLASAAVLPFPPTANPHVTIQSFAVAEAWQAFQHVAKARGIEARLPQELQDARSQLRDNKEELQIRGPGEEQPNLGHVAKRYSGIHQQEKVPQQQDMMCDNDVDKRVILRDHHRPIPMTETLRQLRRMVKSSESTLRRKMSRFQEGQYVLLVKALRQNRSGQVHEVVEVVGSPGLKGSFEAYLSDVLRDMPVDENDTDAPPSGGCDQLDKNATEARNGAAVEENVAAELDVPIVGMNKVVLPPPSSFTPPSVSLAQEDSQDSILDIEGFGDDEDEVSLMDWSAQQDGKVPPSSFQAAGDSAPKQPGNICEGDVQKDRQDNENVWRSQVHPDDPFLSLIPCEIPRLASVLQQCQHNHLEAYKRSGLPISDALGRWFEDGVGHEVWRSIHAHHPDVLGPALVPRATIHIPRDGSKMRHRKHQPSKVAGNLLLSCRRHIKASKTRQQEAARAKALRDSLWYV